MTLRQLNRATLRRQGLLERSCLDDVVAALEAVGGVNAQDAYQPYVSLWSRCSGFDKEHLHAALDERRAVKATLFRSTLHIVSAGDFLRFRQALQPVLVRAFRSYFREESEWLPLESIVDAAHAYTRDRPRTFPEMRRHLQPLAPEAPPPSLSFAACAHLPLVQVPPAGYWGEQGVPAYVSARRWLGEDLSDEEAGRRALVVRYLRAFGPASAPDLTAWTGMSLTRELKELRPELVELVGPDGKTHYDLPGLAEYDLDGHPPVRFLPRWDNLLLSHRDRSRVLPDAYRSEVILSGGRVQPTLLIDGFVAGVWSWQLEDGRATLSVTRFDNVSKRQRDEIYEEGTALLRFLAGGAPDVAVEIRERGQRSGK